MYVICKSAVGDSINLGSVEGTGADRRGKLTTFGFLDTDKLGPSWTGRLINRTFTLRLHYWRSACSFLFFRALASGVFVSDHFSGIVSLAPFQHPKSTVLDLLV